MYRLESALYKVAVIAYAVAKRAITRHMDHVPNVQNHVSFRTHFNGSKLSSFIIYSWKEIFEQF